jgi:hypothetical protein
MEFQKRWVLDNGLWCFDNNLLLHEWEPGLSIRSIVFTHSPFWMQIWGLPFDLMFEEVGKG